MRLAFQAMLWFVTNLFLQWHFDPDGDPDDGPVSRRGIIASLVLLLILVFIGLRIIDVLRETSALQDCVMQGRTNCVPSIR